MANYKAISTVINHNTPNAFPLKIELNEKVGHNDFVLIDGKCRVQEEVAHHLQHWIGENCLDVNTGFDYPKFLELWNSGDKDIARALLTEYINRVRDVTEIIELDLKEDRENHILRVTYRLNTPFGEITKE